MRVWRIWIPWWQCRIRHWKVGEHAWQMLHNRCFEKKENTGMTLELQCEGGSNWNPRNDRHKQGVILYSNNFGWKMYQSRRKLKNIWMSEGNWNCQWCQCALPFLRETLYTDTWKSTEKYSSLLYTGTGVGSESQDKKIFQGRMEAVVEHLSAAMMAFVIVPVEKGYLEAYAHYLRHPLTSDPHFARGKRQQRAPGICHEWDVCWPGTDEWWNSMTPQKPEMKLAWKL